MSLTLIFGGARSGKSAYAEHLAQRAQQQGRQIAYIATAAAGDDEMSQRIACHQQRRPADWQTVEAPLELAAALRSQAGQGRLVLVDCLTVWLSNLLFSESQDFPETGLIAAPQTFLQQRAALLQTLAELSGNGINNPAREELEIVLISNEVGMGIVPMGAINRWFVDEAGRLNQALAAQADNVAWVAAGLPLWLKGAAPC